MNQTFGTVTSSEPHADSSHAISMYCRFCSDVSVAQDDPSASLLKMVVLFQKNVNVSGAYGDIFGQSFLDWEHAFLLKNERCYSDSTTWVSMMRYLEIRMDEPAFKQLLREFPVFSHFSVCLERAKLTVGPWAFVALYLLTNVSRLQSLHVFEQFFSLCERQDVRQEALIFFSQQANMQFDREELTSALVALLTRHCRIKSEVVMQELEMMAARSRELEGLFKQKQMRALVGRPRLRSKLRDPDMESVSMFGMDRLQPWCTNIRFPNVFSLIQKKRLYFVMSQVYLDQSHYIRRILPDKELSKTIMQNPIKAPEVDVLFDCITECRVVNDPFPELHQFRSDCFKSFAQEQKTRLRLNDLLHLYIASYQMPSVWKSVWKLVFPVLSIQIIRDVESFVERVPFAHTHVIALMFNKSTQELHEVVTLPCNKSRLGDADTLSRIDDTESCLGDAESRMDDAESRMDDAESRIDDTLSRMDDAESRIDDTLSRMGDAEEMQSFLNELQSFQCDDSGKAAEASHSLEVRGVHGGVLDPDHPTDAVWRAESPPCDALEEGVRIPAPLAHQLHAAEPIETDLLVSQLRQSRAQRAGNADRVPHQDAGDLPLPLLLHEEPAPEGGVHGAAGPKEELGCGEEHGIDRVDVDKGGVKALD